MLALKISLKKSLSKAFYTLKKTFCRIPVHHRKNARSRINPIVCPILFVDSGQSPKSGQSPVRRGPVTPRPPGFLPVFLPELGGDYFYEFLESPVKSTLGIKTDFISDFNDRRMPLLRRGQHFLGFLDPVMIDKFIEVLLQAFIDDP
jgi:hypothetical protein